MVQNSEQSSKMLKTIIKKRHPIGRRCCCSIKFNLNLGKKKILDFSLLFWCNIFNHVYGPGLDAVWSLCLGFSWCHLDYNTTTTAASDLLTFATFEPRSAARLLFFGLYLGSVCVAAPAPSVFLAQQCFQQKLAAPFSSFLPPSCLPSHFKKKKCFFFSLPIGKIIIIIKNKSNNPSPSCNRRSPVNTVSLLCLSCGKKTKKNQCREGTWEIFTRACPPLASFLPAFPCFHLFFHYLRTVAAVPHLTSSFLSNYFNFSCTSQ